MLTGDRYDMKCIWKQIRKYGASVQESTSSPICKSHVDISSMEDDS